MIYEKYCIVVFSESRYVVVWREVEVQLCDVNSFKLVKICKYKKQNCDSAWVVFCLERRSVEKKKLEVWEDYTARLLSILEMWGKTEIQKSYWLAGCRFRGCLKLPTVPWDEAGNLKEAAENPKTIQFQWQDLWNTTPLL